MNTMACMLSTVTGAADLTSFVTPGDSFGVQEIAKVAPTDAVIVCLLSLGLLAHAIKHTNFSIGVSLPG